jgi:hypothetical protein
LVGGVAGAGVARWVRGAGILAAAAGLQAGCVTPTAELTGTAGGVKWSATESVFFGASYIVISQLPTDCQGVSWVERNYDVTVPPSEEDQQALQFTFSGDEVQAGSQAVAKNGAVLASIVEIHEGLFTESQAASGVLVVDEVTEDFVTGSIDTLTFDGDQPGPVSGTFTAAYCLNLKP